MYRALRLVPKVCTAANAAMAIKVTIREYSIIVAPFSFISIGCILTCNAAGSFMASLLMPIMAVGLFFLSLSIIKHSASPPFIMRVAMATNKDDVLEIPNTDRRQQTNST